MTSKVQRILVAFGFIFIFEAIAAICAFVLLFLFVRTGELELANADWYFRKD
jgi:hypothetical protein